mgnify:FL=1
MLGSKYNWIITSELANQCVRQKHYSLVLYLLNVLIISLVPLKCTVGGLHSGHKLKWK